MVQKDGVRSRGAQCCQTVALQIGPALPRQTHYPAYTLKGSAHVLEGGMKGVRSLKHLDRRT